jgi:hypothetical protein
MKRFFRILVTLVLGGAGRFQGDTVGYYGRHRQRGVRSALEFAPIWICAIGSRVRD